MEWKLTVLTQGWFPQCFGTCCLTQELYVNVVKADCTHPKCFRTCCLIQELYVNGVEADCTHPGL